MSTRRNRPWTSWLGALGVLIASAVYFHHGLEEEPFFADESADIAQTYYYRLAKGGEWNHSDWIHPAAYDHLPVFKYLIGGYLDLAGYGERIPRSTSDWEWWIGGHFDPPRDRELLHAARIPMLWGAVLGCVMIYVLACQLLGPKTGLLAAALLALSPDYYTHARRVMADDLTQGLVMAGLALFLMMLKTAPSRNEATAGKNEAEESPVPLSRTRWIWGGVLGGLVGGLAAATKLNGAVLELSLLAFVVVLFASAVFLREGRRLYLRQVIKVAAAAVLLGATSLLLFVAINPYFYAQPTFDESGRVVGETRKRTAAYHQLLREVANFSLKERMVHLLEHRTAGLEEATVHFKDQSLPTVASRLRSVMMEGLGRWTAVGRLPFSPFARATLASLLVVMGWLVLVGEGWAQWRHAVPPGPWLVALWPLVEVSMLMRTLSLDWDRYYLGVVAAASLLMALGISASAGWVRGRVLGKMES